MNPPPSPLIDAPSAQAHWSRPADDLLQALGSSPTGLGAAQAAQRLREQGPNSLGEDERVRLWPLVWRQLKSPLVLILVFAGAISALLGDWLEAGIVLAVVLASSGVGCWQEFRASHAVAQLRQRLSLKARVYRDGALVSVPTGELVPGDVVELAAGHLVPADGRVLQAKDCLVSESSLTGESFPVEKAPGVCPETAVVAARSNTVFLGTSVRSGTARVLIVATGERTAFGAVAQRLRVTPPETEFARGVQQFGGLLLRVMVAMVLFVLVVNQWLDRPWVESMLFALALAVGMSPEMLPAIVSVTLSAGARRLAQGGVIVRHPEAIENLGSMDVLCTDKTGTLTEGRMTLARATAPDGSDSAEVLRLGFLNAALESGIDNPLDAALVAAGQAAGLSTAGGEKVDELPYDFVRRRLTVVWQPTDGGPRQVVCKGAVDNVLAICTQVWREGQAVPLDGATRDALAGWYAEQGQRGFRLLGLATRSLPGPAPFTREDETGLCFMGFLLFADPPRASAAATVRSLARRGIRVKIVTGDNRHVAGHVAQAVGLNAQAVLTGDEIAQLREEALWQRAQQTDLFAEVDPQQKERIIRAMQRGGSAVGYLGDGINDAPALHAADVGISVEGAVDVARESADMVLLRPDLAVLCQGVDEGRRTFANTLKYVGITTSANFGNMVSMALAAPLLPFLPLAAKQVLLNNFLSDLPSMAISADRVDDEHLRQAQHWHMADLRRYMLVFGLTSTVFDLLTFWLLLRVFNATEPLFQTAWFVVSVLTEVAVLLVLRTRRPFWASRPGRGLALGAVGVGLLALALPHVPLVAGWFGFVSPGAGLVAALLGVVLAYVLATEAVKRVFFQRSRPAQPRRRHRVR